MVNISFIMRMACLPRAALNRLLNFIATLVSGKKISIDWLDLKIRGSKRIFVGKNFSAGRGLWLETINSGVIKIGDNVNISDYVHIGSLNHVEIMDGALIGSKVLITDHSHGQTGRAGIAHFELRPNLRPLFSKGTTLIGRSVWIGDGVCVLPGVSIGDGAIIGANSVVVSNIPPGTIWGGSPAQQIWPK